MSASLHPFHILLSPSLQGVHLHASPSLFPPFFLFHAHAHTYRLFDFLLVHSPQHTNMLLFLSSCKQYVIPDPTSPSSYRAVSWSPCQQLLRTVLCLLSPIALFLFSPNSYSASFCPHHSTKVAPVKVS